MPFDPAFVRSLESLNLLARRLLSGEDPGERRSDRRGASVEFADHRRYAPGDEIRYIDWNVYARHGSLFVKEFAAEESVHVHVILDRSASMAFGRPPKMEAAREVAAALAYIGLARFDTVTVHAMAEALETRTPALRGKGAVHELLRSLEDLQPAGRSDFRAALAAPLARGKGRSLAILVSDFHDPEGRAAGISSLLSRRHQVHLVHLVAREEVEPPERGRYHLVDLETGRERAVPLTPAVVERYRGRFRAFCDELERYARERELYYSRIRSDEPLEKRIRDLLRRGGILESR